jgi:tetratricopeptide (TPR) repeat protein
MPKHKLFISIIFTLLSYFSGWSQSVEQNNSTQMTNQPKDTTILAFNKKQYEKMISKGDILYTQKEYLKSKKLYQRAIRFQPNWDNVYAKDRVWKIDRILFELAESVEVYVKEYQENFQQGITEDRVDLKFNRYNEVIAYVIIRVVVIKEKYNIYKKHVVRSNITYSKNGEGVSKQVWNDESNNVTLRWN